MLPPDIPQYFVPGAASARPLPSRSLLGVARVTFADAKLGINETRDVVAAAPIGDGAVPVDWAAAEILDVAPSDLATSPDRGRRFDQCRRRPRAAKNYAAWQKAFASWVASAQTLELQRHAGLKLTSKAGESERDFRIRVQNAQREARDAAVEQMRQKFAEKRARAGREAAQRGTGRHARAGAGHEREAADRRVDRRDRLRRAVRTQGDQRRHARTRDDRGARRRARAKEQEDVRRAQQNVDAVKKALEDLDAQIAEETTAIAARFDADAATVEKVALAPKRGQVDVQFVALGWRAK